MKNNFLSFIWEVLKIVIIAAVIVIPVRYFLFQPFFIRGQSMDPNFENGDYLIIDEITYRFRAPERGEVIVFKYPEDPSSRFIKRVIALPGETIEIKNGDVTIYNKIGTYLLNEDYLPSDLSTTGNLMVTLGEDEYFVMGDNRPYSYDSRKFGLLSKKYIIGKVIIRAWPLSSLSVFDSPLYEL